MKIRFKKTALAFSFVAAGLLAGCNTTVPKGSLALSAQSLENRNMQSKVYENLDEKQVISTAVAVMQDLGYTIKETESNLGLVVGEKRRDATEAGQVAMAIGLALMGVSSSFDDKQVIKMSLVVSPVTLENKTRYQARIALQRIVWNTRGQISKIESLADQEIYQEFFNKLDKALFLEKNA
jgi:hypothetical protein